VCRVRGGGGGTLLHSGGGGGTSGGGLTSILPPAHPLPKFTPLFPSSIGDVCEGSPYVCTQDVV